MQINLLDYIDLTLVWKDDFPKFNLKLKPECKITNEIPYRSDGMPQTGIQESYFIHYLGEDLGKLVYSERRKIISKKRLIEWYIQRIPDDLETIKKLQNHISYLSKQLIDGQNRHYNSPEGEVRKKEISERMLIQGPKLAAENSIRWKDEDYKNAQIKKRHESGHYERSAASNKKKYEDPEFKQWFIEQVNKPERVEKIRAHSIEMWRQFKDGESNRYAAMVKSGSIKKFNLDGRNMNLIEFIIGTVLNELNVEWENQKVFKFGKKWYIVDFYLPKYDLVIECNGDYWHANPKFFKFDSIIHSSKKASEFWEYDLIRKTAFESEGYKFLVLWENEIKLNEEYCKQQILNQINE